MTRDNLLAKIRKWYDGYAWNGKTSVYNPFSTLMFFSKQKFSNYWFETGTPTFLINRLKKRSLAKTVLEPIVAGPTAFNSYAPDALEDIPLLFQTGYLTVKNETLTNGDPLYTLEVPNMEVKESLMEHLLSAFTNYPLSKMSELGREMLQQIRNYDVEGLTNNLRKMLAGVPYTLQTEDHTAEDASEARYHIIFQVWMTLLGFWKGDWIKHPSASEDKHIWFRKKLTLDETAATAFAYVASIGYHELYVNGQKADSRVLAPAVSRIDKRILYVTYDIAPLLRKGENLIALWYGAGWTRNNFFQPLVGQAVLVQVDGKTKKGGDFNIYSDETWKSPKVTAVTPGVSDLWIWVVKK